MEHRVIAVTGGAGFIGSAVIWKLNKRGEDDILVVDEPGTAADCAYLETLAYSEYEEKGAFLKGIEAGRFDGRLKSIIHMGACSSTTEMNEAFLDENNRAYTRTLAEFALRTGARFIYASSAATYGDGSVGYDDDEAKLGRLRPLNPYAVSKHEFDLWAVKAEVMDRIAGLKYFNVFGPNEGHKGDMRSMVCKGLEQIEKSGVVRLFKSDRPEYKHGGQERDFIYVKDAAEMTLFFLDNPEKNGLYNIGSGRANTWNTLIAAIFRALGKKDSIEYIDMPKHLKGRYQYHTCANMDKLQSAGYKKQCTPIEDAVRDYVVNYLVPGKQLTA